MSEPEPTNEQLHDRLDRARLLATGLLNEVETFETIDSTQEHASRRAREPNVALPLLITAEEQTAGRGRGANRWWTGRGSLAFSLLLDPANWDLPRQVRPERSLAVGVAIVETLRPLVPADLPLGLHWPNDVFVQGKKLAGVLVDVLTDGRNVVGIGLNVNNSFAGAPEEVRGRATSLIELAGVPFDRTEILATLVRNLRAAFHDALTSPELFGRRFNDLCLQIGRELTIDVAGKRTTGVCAGIAADGALLLETPQGFQKFYSGVLDHTA